MSLIGLLKLSDKSIKKKTAAKPLRFHNNKNVWNPAMKIGKLVNVSFVVIDTKCTKIYIIKIQQVSLKFIEENRDKPHQARW